MMEEWSFVCPKCGETEKKAIAVFKLSGLIKFRIAHGYPEVLDFYDTDEPEKAEYFRCPSCYEELDEKELVEGAKKWSETPEAKTKLFKES